MGGREYSEETAKIIDEEVHAIVEEAYHNVKLLLSEYRPTLDRIAQELRKHEIIDNKHLMIILKETGVDIETAAQAVLSPGEGDKYPRIPPQQEAATSPISLE